MTALSGTLRPSPVLRGVLRKINSRRGLAPGDVAAPPDTHERRRDRPVTVAAMTYDAAHLAEHADLNGPSACDVHAAHVGDDTPDGVTWLLADGAHDADLIECLGHTFGLHRLVQEDIASTTQRAKFEDYGDVLYIVLPMITFDAEHAELRVEQVSLVAGAGWVLTFLEDPGDVFDPVRARLRAGSPLRRKGADALVTALVDVIVDSYFTALEAAGDAAEDIEELVVERPAASVQYRISTIRRELLLLRRAIWPVREAISAFERSDSPLLADDTRPYLRDAYDHAVQAVDIAESLRDLVAGMMDLYLSSLSNRMNEVMKVLTVVSVVFLPLTLVSGIFGMNVALPWQHNPHGFWLVMGVMGLCALTMLAYFRRRRWL